MWSHQYFSSSSLLVTKTQKDSECFISFQFASSRMLPVFLMLRCSLRIFSSSSSSSPPFCLFFFFFFFFFARLNFFCAFADFFSLSFPHRISLPFFSDSCLSHSLTHSFSSGSFKNEGAQVYGNKSNRLAFDLSFASVPTPFLLGRWQCCETCENHSGLLGQKLWAVKVLTAPSILSLFSWSGWMFCSTHSDTWERRRRRGERGESANDASR